MSNDYPQPPSDARLHRAFRKNAAWALGWVCRQAGYERSHNPYSEDVPQHHAWRHGWTDADQVAQSEGEAALRRSAVPEAAPYPGREGGPEGGYDPEHYVAAGGGERS